MVLGFKTHNNGKPTGFVEKIIAGTKIHTLREDAFRRWKAGMHIEFATGVRTKEYEQFMNGTCKSIQEVRINNHGILMISIDGRFLRTKAEILEFVNNDGFETEEEFEAWFTPLIKKSWKEQDRALMLRLIHWTDFRY